MAQAVENLLREWDSEHKGVPPEESTLPVRFELQALRLLAEGSPVSSDRLAAEMNLPADLVRIIFEATRARGEWDDQGRLLGQALTLVPTQHHFKVDGKDLYAWCAFDTLFLPALLGKTAQVESVDPVSGEKVQLTVTPDGVVEFSPEGMVLSVFLEGEPTGPQSSMCSQMHFFGSRESAETWLKDHPGVSLASLEEAFEMVRTYVISPFERALGELGAQEL